MIAQDGRAEAAHTEPGAAKKAVVCGGSVDLGEFAGVQQGLGALERQVQLSGAVGEDSLAAISSGAMNGRAAVSSRRGRG